MRAASSGVVARTVPSPRPAAPQRSGLHVDERGMQLAVHRRVPPAARVDEVDGDLRVFDPAGGAGALAPDTDGVRVLLHLPGRVPHPAPGLNPREPARYPARQDPERLLPAGRVCAVTRGHHKISVFTHG